jgi:hypothetical protein
MKTEPTKCKRFGLGWYMYACGGGGGGQLLSSW